MSKTISTYVIGIAVVTAVLVGAFTHISGLDTKLHLTDFIAHASGLNDGGESGSGCCGGGSSSSGDNGHEAKDHNSNPNMCNGAAIPNGCTCQITESHGCSASKGECTITETLKCPTPKDFCPNISGTQSSVPSGYVTDSSGNCVIDQCPNISGVQTSVPAGYVVSNGQCVIDQCPNIDGVQTSVPSGYTKDSAGLCQPPKDYCPNISGVQTSVPAGYVVSNGNCVIDQCPNIDGVQESLPAGYTKDSYGKCQPPKDYCPNIAGVQSSVPSDKIVDKDGNCVPPPPTCITTGVTGSVKGDTATLIVPANGCPVKVSFTSYSHNGTIKPFEDQVMLQNITDTYGPGTHKIGPLTLSCNWQTDLYYGDVLEHLTPTGHGPARQLIAYDYVEHQICNICVPPTLTSATSSTGTVGTPFSYTLSVAGTAPVTVKFDNLPAGLTASGNVISGTPTKAGDYTVNITLDNKCGNLCTTIKIKIVDNKCPIDPPKVVDNQNTSGKVGDPFSYEIQVTNDPTEVTATGLPDGLTINKNTGVISGTPTKTGTFEVTLSAKNQCGKDDGKLKIVITSYVCPLPVPHITSGSSASATLNQAFSYTLTTSGSPSTINAGTLPGWLSYNSTTGVLSGIPTSAGTYTVEFNISNQCGSDHQTLTIVVTGNGGSCTLVAPTITSGTDLSVTAGQQLSYTITTSGTVTSLSVENLPSWLNFSTSSQVLFGTAPQSGNYSVTIKAANQCALAQITVNIHVVGAPGCTVNCGGGGFFAPTVVLLQHATSTNPLASYASVYLSQVPYTGAGDIATTLAFLLGLLGLSLGVAYVIVYRKELTQRIFGGRIEPTYSVVAVPAAVFETPMFGGGLPDHPAYGASQGASTDATVYEEMPKKKEETTEDENTNVKTFHSSDFGASISEGLAAMKQNFDRREAAVAAPAMEVAQAPNVEAMGATLEEAARASGAMLSKDGVELILTAADNKIDNALRILNQMISVAAEWYPAGEGAYLMLDAARVRSILFSTYVSMVPLFVRWIADNDHAKVFNFLRMINHQGHAVSDFVKAVAYELDKVYRFRTEHDAGADEYSVQATANWKKETIEKVVTTLVGGFDDNYSSSLTAAKLAFSKVLDMVRTQNIPAAEQFRLAEGN